MRAIGIIEVVVVALVLVPRTAFIGAILFTGWAGGAIMTHFRVGDPVILQALLPILVWIGLGLRRQEDFAPLLGLKRAPERAMPLKPLTDPAWPRRSAATTAIGGQGAEPRCPRAKGEG